MKFRLNIAIFGATGYTGIELIRLLKFHKKVDIKYLISKKNFNKKVSDFYPALEFEKYSKLIKFSQVDWKDLDVIFLCLPTNESKKILKKIPKHVCIIDLSNDLIVSEIVLAKGTACDGTNMDRIKSEFSTKFVKVPTSCIFAYFANDLVLSLLPSNEVITFTLLFMSCAPTACPMSPGLIIPTVILSKILLIIFVLLHLIVVRGLLLVLEYPHLLILGLKDWQIIG